MYASLVQDLVSTPAEDTLSALKEGDTLGAVLAVGTLGPVLGAVEGSSGSQPEGRAGTLAVGGDRVGDLRGQPVAGIQLLGVGAMRGTRIPGVPAELVEDHGEDPGELGTPEVGAQELLVLHEESK